MSIIEHVTKITSDRWSLLTAILAILIGSILTLSVEVWYESSPPNLTEIDSIVTSKSPNGDTLLGVVSKGAPAHNCVRVSQHVMYTDHSDPRTYIPLASALNGVGFGSVKDFEVILDVPAGVTGDFIYSARSAYFCTVWPGLLVIKESTSKPYKVHID